MTKEEFICGLQSCGYLRHNNCTWYEHDELIKCFEDLGLLEPTTKNDLGVDWESYKDVGGNSLDDLILEVLQNNFDCGNTYGYKVADEIIGLLPSVTPIRPTGSWIDTNDDGFLYHRIYKCSHCGNTVCDYPENIQKYKYCLNCGAKMESEE